MKILSWYWVTGEFEYLNFEKEIETAEKELKNIQTKLFINVTIDECIILEGKFYELDKNNEFFWFMRSRVSEVKEGDWNIFYFYNKVS